MKFLKLIILSVAILFLDIQLKAQTSDMGFSFQGYAIDPDGKAIASTGITVKFTLSPGTFTEEHSLTTDAFGVFTAIVGNSSAQKKIDFSKLDFTKKGVIYTLKVEVKKTSGGSYTTISDAPLKAVPYARYAFNGVPVGSIVAFGGDKNNVPEGWLLCDGSSVSQTDYSQLYAMIGAAWGSTGSSFNLPDLRGRFLRGVNDGAGLDPNAGSRVAIKTGGNTGDNVGTVQDDGIESHNSTGSTTTTGNHNHTEQQTTVRGIDEEDDNYNPAAQTGANQPTAISTGGTGSHNHSVSVSYSGLSETRPVNAGVFYIIKY